MILIRRCAWHGRLRRWAVTGLRFYRPLFPLRVTLTDGLCSRHVKALRAEIHAVALLRLRGREVV